MTSEMMRSTYGMPHIPEYAVVVLKIFRSKYALTVFGTCVHQRNYCKIITFASQLMKLPDIAGILPGGQTASV